MFLGHYLLKRMGGFPLNDAGILCFLARSSINCHPQSRKIERGRGDNRRSHQATRGENLDIDERATLIPAFCQRASVRGAGASMNDINNFIISLPSSPKMYLKSSLVWKSYKDCLLYYDRRERTFQSQGRSPHRPTGSTASLSYR